LVYGQLFIMASPLVSLTASSWLYGIFYNHLFKK